MRNIILPIIFIIVAGALFFAFIKPQYQEVKKLESEVGQYNTALNKSKKLIGLRDQLLSKYNTFSTSNLEKLDHLLPGHVDNVRLVLEINNVAARNGLMVNDISISKNKKGENNSGETGGSISSAGSSGSPSSGNRMYNAIDLEFSVKADYKSFVSFLRDLEKNLRLTDVNDISFEMSKQGASSFKVGIRTYWLK